MISADLKLLVTRSGASICVTWRGDGVGENSMLNRGAAEASFVGDTWWVNRVLVQPRENRGRGIGGHMLEALKGAVVEEGGAELSVQPGGYDMNTADQNRFYEAHGFTCTDEKEGLFVWRVNAQK